jgi:hypothetical protein
MTKCSDLLESYWDRSLERNDDEVNQELVADGRLWLESWTSAFSLATTNATKVTGLVIPLPDPDNKPGSNNTLPALTG